MESCETCKHWQKSEQQLRRLHTAENVAFCVAIEAEDTNAEDFAKTDALAGIDYPVAALLTKNTFGCVLWEKAEK